MTPTAEFNFHQDPEAAYIVLETFQCQVYLLTWELTLATEVTLVCSYILRSLFLNFSVPYLYKDPRSDIWLISLHNFDLNC